MKRQRAYHVLELDTVLDMLKAHAVSSGAKARIDRLVPSRDVDEIRQWQRQTTDAKQMMVLHGAPSFGGIRDLSSHLRRLSAGGVLNAQELLDIAALLRCAEDVKKYSAEEETNSLTDLFSRIQTNRSLAERIGTSILSAEEIADGASPELYQIRRQMRQQNGKIRDILSKMVAAGGSYLQEAIITQRNGRFVIPVKAEHKGDVAGMVHDVSSSGATLFIEPARVVEANNALKELSFAEQAEMERILADLSNSAAAFAGGLSEDMAVLSLLDFVFAKAKFSFALNGAESTMREGYFVRLVRARHPLIDSRSVVPVDIALGQGYDTLVITGPNTGGKTVSLKILGLLTLMAACGLHIPASEESEVGVFEHIYADIGDEQSIEQSLSTFSAHMKNIVSIVQVCRQGDMVLFDELGAGTDPTEGAALAVSIIEYTRQMAAFVAATTHYAELKAYALTTDGVENASCEFDVRTLQPTYRLITGVPGKSNAFAIGARLGLPDAIIQRAKQQMSEESIGFESMLATLERERLELERYKAEADKMRREAQSERDRAENLKDKTERENDQRIQRAKEKAEAILKDARMTAETVFLELDDVKKKAARQAAEQNLAAAKAALRGALNEAEAKVRKSSGKKTVSPSEIQAFAAGDDVELLNMGVDAVVLAPADKDGKVLVQAGILKMSVRENEIRRKQAPPKPKGKVYRPAPGGVSDLLRTSAKSEVDVRGLCAEDAILEVDQFISQALMAGLNTATIIHGKGTGVLRAAIQQHLKRNKRIKSVRNGQFGEGEMGVTVIEFR